MYIIGTSSVNSTSQQSKEKFICLNDSPAVYKNPTPGGVESPKVKKNEVIWSQFKIILIKMEVSSNFKDPAPKW